MTQSWSYKTIGDVCEIVNGATPKTGTSAFWDGPHQWATPAEMGKRLTPYLDETSRSLTAAGLDSCSASPVPPHSVIMSSRAPIGHLVINTVPMSFNQGCKGLVPRPELDHKFLYYYLFSKVAHLNELGTGATFKELSAGSLKRVEIPVPPFPEQQRIVGILDQSFEAIAKVKANAERNLFKTKTMLAEELRTMLTAGREGWIRTTIGEQLTLQRGYDITKSEQRPGEIPVVSSSGIKSYHSDSKVRGPGVVIGRKGTLGSAFYIEGDFWPHDTSLYVKDFKGNNPKFVYYAFCGLNVKHLDSGTANPALNRNTVHALQVNWPPFGLQSEFCAYLDELCDGSGRLEALYSSKIQQFNDLKASVLHQAFSGKL